MRTWGRLGAWPHDVERPCDPNTLVASLMASARAHRTGIAVGLARSYGDACINHDGVLWDTTSLDHFVSFDENTGRLLCEAGVSLRHIQRLFIPRGWSLPVTPGTLRVTVGGAIANDVHGKNQHRRGSFGHHVTWLRLARTDGQFVDCGPELKPDWFSATIGGVGLTGVIVAAEIQLLRLPGPWVEAEHRAFETLEEFFVLAAEDDPVCEHSVAWVDCFGSRAGRGIWSRARSVGGRGPAAPRPVPPVPGTPPLSLVNRWTSRLFNAAYFARRRRGRRGIEHHEAFLYPLDQVEGWNRLYGPRGFYQYHCLVPRARARESVAALIGEVSRAEAGSPLAVLKVFGEHEPRGILSFARPGVSLAMDLPNQGERTTELMARLDAVLLSVGGRLYLAKDARMPRAVFAAGYPDHSRLARFRDPGIASTLSRRLLDS